MNDESVIYVCIALSGVFIASVAQVILKKAAMKPHVSVIKEYLNPLVIIAYMLLLLSTVFAIYAYKVIPLSFGPILEASSYLYVTIFGVYIFDEKFDRSQLKALGIIILGIMIYVYQ